MYVNTANNNRAIFIFKDYFLFPPEKIVIIQLDSIKQMFGC